MTIEVPLAIPDGAWAFGRRAEDGEPVDWLPIIPVPGKDWVLGMSREGAWVRGSSSRVIEMQGDGFVAALPFLEMTRSEFELTAIEEVVGRGLSPEIGRRLPVEQLVRTGLSRPRDYWPGLAMAWLSDASAKEMKRVSPLLRSLHEDKKGRSQKTRQNAFRLLSRLDSRPSPGGTAVPAR